MTENLILDFPLVRPHAGIPMANGNFGALVWGDRKICVTVNQSDLWDHRCGDLVDERDTYRRFAEYASQHGCDHGLNDLFHRPEVFTRSKRVPVGRFDFLLEEGIRPLKAELDYSSGILIISLSGGSQIRMIAILKQNIFYVDDPDRKITSVQLHPATDFPKVKNFFREALIPDYERLEDGWTIRIPEEKPFTVRAVRTVCGYKIFTNDEGDESRREEQIAFTSTWWKSFFERTARVTTPDPWWNRFYNFSLYKFGAMTCPFGIASGLQGPWHEEYQNAQWSGDFHFNVNVQMIYGPACAAGVPEHLLPLFELIETPDFQTAMKHNAKALFGVEDALWQTHAVDDRGRQCGGLSAGSVLDPACGAWTALLYWDYYRYTNDRTFLRDRAWPYIYGIMRGYEEMLDEGFNIPVAISAEYASSNQDMPTVAGRNPSYQLAAIRKLATILIEAASILGREERPIWRKILEKMPHYTTVSSFEHYSGKVEPRIGIWENQDLAICHRHHSHLGAIWPFDSLPEEFPPEMNTVLGNTIDHWISMGSGLWSEWCMPWAAMIFTRMGLQEAPMQLFTLWKEIFVNEGLTTVYLPRMLSLVAHRRLDIAKPKDENEVMQMDGQCGFLSAFLEMCAYPRFNKVHLFRGMPEKWKDVRIENLLLPGGGRLNAVRNGACEISGGSRKFLQVQV